MQNIQELFNHTREMKKEKKDLRDMYKDALSQADEYDEIVEQIKALREEKKDLRDMYKDALSQAYEYDEIVEQIKALREKKKQIEERIKLQMGRAYEKIEELDIEIKTEKEMMNDIAISTLMKGETVVVRDEFDNDYEPAFKVSFHKDNSGKTLK